jgi:hypothetical protein
MRARASARAIASELNRKTTFGIKTPVRHGYFSKNDYD